MRTQQATAKEIAEWKKIFEEYRGKLRPNRQSGEALAAYLADVIPSAGSLTSCSSTAASTRKI